MTILLQIVNNTNISKTKKGFHNNFINKSKFFSQFILPTFYNTLSFENGDFENFGKEILCNTKL